MNRDKTYRAARTKWRGILLQLGVNDNFLKKGKPGPCPWCGGDDRFTFDDKEGSGSFICRACGAGMGMEFVKRVTGLPFAEAAARVDEIVGNLKPDASRPSRPEMTEEQQRNACLSTWNATKKAVPGDYLYRYLASRGLGDIECPDHLRLHPALRDGEGGIRPCMIAKISGPDGLGVSLHRTYLRPDGYGKAEMEKPRKFMPGALPEGSVIRLGPASADIGIAEGIENALSASRLFDLPVWSALDAGHMEKWLPPEGTETLTVFADSDENYRGQRAAYVLANNVCAKCPWVEVIVKLPPAAPLDWNDILISEQGRKSA